MLIDSIPRPSANTLVSLPRCVQMISYLFIISVYNLYLQIFHLFYMKYCQGMTKKLRNDPNDNEHIVTSGGDLLINFAHATLINADATQGIDGFHDDST